MPPPFPFLFATVLSIEPGIKHVLGPLTSDLFLTCTWRIFCFYTGHADYNVTHNIMIYFSEKRPITWNGGFFHVVANPHPCWPLAQSQLPRFKSPPQPNTHPFFPLFLSTQALLYMQTTLACPNCLALC
jgi:hypothetical protein